MKNLVAILILGTSLVGLSACTGNPSGANLVPKTLSAIPISAERQPDTLSAIPISKVRQTETLSAIPI